jgi:hypothetical protein
MNTFQAVSVSYILPSKTLETILLKDGIKERVLYVYNFEGWHFRVFKSLLEIIDFFDEKFESVLSFESDDELDEFLLNLDLKEEAFFS